MPDIVKDNWWVKVTNSVQIPSWPGVLYLYIGLTLLRLWGGGDSKFVKVIFSFLPEGPAVLN
jgi:hypothetical protein